MITVSCSSHMITVMYNVWIHVWNLLLIGSSLIIGSCVPKGYRQWLSEVCFILFSCKYGMTISLSFEMDL